MFWLIENIKKIDEFIERKHEDVFVEVIPTSHKAHPSINTISSVYIRPKTDNKGYIVSVDHNDTINIPLEKVEELLQSFKRIYVRDKKLYLHYFINKHVYQPPPSPHPYILELTDTHEFFMRLYPKHKRLNTIIPIVKHYETCELAFKAYDFENVSKFYSMKAAPVFNMIERTPIKVDPTLYKHYFGKNTKGYAYTNYNLNTTTTRPSNTFGGLNFSTLSKETNERETFIPNNDIFIEMDVSAYHPSILANILDYTFPCEDIHKHFSDVYKVDYERAKEITFQQIYGGIWDQYKDIEFFKRVKEYTEEKWDEFNNTGSITSPTSGYKFEKDKLEMMNPQKLLNYILQERETSTNVLILWEIFKVLKGLNTKIVLTVYDSFLIDLDITEKDCIFEIEKIFTRFNLKVKYKKGKNYNFK